MSQQRQPTRRRPLRPACPIWAALLLGAWWGARSPQARAADCNGNGLDDAGEILQGQSRDCNEDGTPDECEIELPAFQESGGLPLGAITAGVAADLNGDGKLEMVVWFAQQQQPFQSGLCVYYQGDRRRLDPVVVYGEQGAAQSVRALASGDFNGDGSTDLVAIQPRAFILFAQQPAAQGRPRLFGPRGGVPVRGFQPGGILAQPIASPVALESFYCASAVGDVDGDGDSDIIVGAASTPELRVFLGGPSPLGVSKTVPCEAFAAGLALLDGDGDGDLDLATVDGVSSDIRCFKNDGHGVFIGAARTTVEDTLLTRIATADFDRDGIADLAVAGAGAVTVVRGTGSLQPWGDARAFRLDARGLALKGLHAADLSDDGAPDLLLVRRAGEHQSLYLRNDGRGRLDVGAVLPLSELAIPIQIVDMDGDGRLDIPCITAEGGKPSVAWRSEAARTGGRGGSPASFATGRQRLGFEPHSSVLADLDGDGDLDLAVIDGEWDVHILKNDGHGAFARRETFSMVGANELISLAGADLDGDGDIDLAGVDEMGELNLLLNGGNGNYTQTSGYHVGSRPWKVLAADIDGDGLPELLTANMGSNSVAILSGLGRGAFSAPRQIRVGASPSGLAATDIDGDGDMDIAVACTGSGEVLVLRNEPKGTLTPAQRLGAGNPFTVEAADLDGDGLDELLCSSAYYSSVTIFHNRRGSFEAGTAIEVEQPVRSITTCDLDRDGKVDLITANEQSNTLCVAFNLGGLRFGEPSILRAGYDPRFAVAGDIDGDGDGDIVAANHSSLDLSIFRFERRKPEETAYTRRICTERELARFALSSEGGEPGGKTLKFVAPARTGDSALLPLVFQDVHLYPLHQDFLAQAFPERFPALPRDEYDRLTGRRATRKYFAGLLRELPAGAGRRFGFELASACLDDPAEAPTLEEVTAVHALLRDSFQVGEVVYQPQDAPARDVAADWTSPGFPVVMGIAGPLADFSAYTPGVAFGRVRILTPEELTALNTSGGITYQDILVLERAPRDIEGVFGGVLTGEPQGELSHIGVRTARRGTPNAYLAGATHALEPWRGKLVRLEVTAASHDLREAEPAEAEAWWIERRPRLTTPPRVDASARDLPSLLEMDLSAAASPPESRYGGKATNLARLQRILTGPFEHYREDGFAIPVAYYLDFLRSNQLASPLDSSRMVTYEEYLTELEGWDAFQTSPELRFEALGALRSHMLQEGRLPEGLLARLRDRIREVFGSELKTIRIRSSSNVEDALEFNGAGLYDSTSGCIADDHDGDEAGPCLCDPLRLEERPVEKAIKRVWASLSNSRAHEERAYYGVSSSECAMGILVSRAFGVERLNGVAFTGNPSRSGDARYVVTAQSGEESVVSPDPGVLAEKTLLEIEAGDVRSIFRAQPSSLAAPGGVVLSDDRLRELGRALAHIRERFPVDLGGHRPEDVLLDVEFKETTEGALAIKQVRPFLRSDAAPPAPVFELEIPEDLVLCGSFVQSRPPATALELESTLRLRPGIVSLPASGEPFPADLFLEATLGSAGVVAKPAERGRFEVSSHRADEAVVYQFRYSQRLLLPDGRALEVSIPELRFVVDGGKPVDPVIFLDDAALDGRVSVQGDLGRIIEYGCCACETLPLWSVRATAADGLVIELAERHRPPRNATETGPAALVHATVRAPGGLRRDVSSYWSLLYTALRHNRSVRDWILLEPPIELPGINGPVRILEVTAPEPRYKVEPQLRYLGPDLEVLGTTPIASWERNAAQALLLRGDVDGDGTVSLADALRIVAIALGGESGALCLKAGDIDDDGDVDALDACLLLQRQLQPSKEAFGCSLDSTPDDLPCSLQPACPGGRP